MIKYLFLFLNICIILVNAQSGGPVYFPESGNVIAQGVKYQLLWDVNQFSTDSLLTIQIWESDGIIGGITDDFVYTLVTNQPNTGSFDFAFNNLNNDYDFSTESEFYFYIEKQCDYWFVNCPSISSGLFYITDPPTINFTPMDTLTMIELIADSSVIKYGIQVKNVNTDEIVYDLLFDIFRTNDYNPFYLLPELLPNTQYSCNMYYGYSCSTCTDGILYTYYSGFIYNFITLPKALCTYDSLAAFFSKAAYLDWYFDENTNSGISFDWCGVTWNTDYAYSEFTDHVFIHSSEDQVVISFRGTEPGIADWFDNIDNTAMAECNAYGCTDPDSRLGIGFLNAFADTNPYYIGIELAYDNDKDIIVTGHSQGGAIATIATLYIQNYDDTDYNIYTYTFGSPSVGNEEFVNEYILSNKLSFRYVASYHNDILGIELYDGVTLSGALGSEHVPTGQTLYCAETYRGGFASCHSMDNYLIQMFKTTPSFGILITGNDDTASYSTNDYSTYYSTNDYSTYYYNYYTSSAPLISSYETPSTITDTNKSSDSSSANIISISYIFLLFLTVCVLL
jgi:hypothetical protein